MDFLLFLLTGLIVGAIARFVVPGRQPMGLIKTMGLGCLGSLAAGTVGKLLFEQSLGFATAGFFFSILGAVGVLLLGMRFSRNRA